MKGSEDWQLACMWLDVSLEVPSPYSQREDDLFSQSCYGRSMDWTTR